MDLRPGSTSQVESRDKTDANSSLKQQGRPEPAHLVFYRWVLRKLFPGLRKPLRIGIWTGEEFQTEPGTPITRVQIRDRWTFLQLLYRPILAFGDAYTEGRIVVEGDLASFIEQIFQSWPRAEGARAGSRLARQLQRPRDNSLKGSRQNIHRHYDIGNDFYRLWLDEQLVYTCAYFPSWQMSLEDAQIAKMDHVCRKVQLRRGQTVVEAGCGWGALSCHMARNYGVNVRAFNISHEQVAYARERAKKEGLGDRVEFVEDDYRNVTGQYDAFVSVGMLEHVGPAHYRELGAVIHRSLKPEGLGLIHSIGRNRPAATNPWLEARIFPGAYMPALSEILQVFEPFEFSVLDVENLRLHYAKTLEHWLKRFEAESGRVEAMFDQRFVRAWRFYLASSMAGFTSGFMQLFQVVFAHGTNNQVPQSRAYMYRDELAGGISG
jgi:cyclopropane-fatty-acyl-phospholipid synthase